MGRKLLLLLVFAVLALSQQNKDSKGRSPDNKSDKSKDQPPEKKQPAPLFGGQIGTRSSQTSKESATLGFNGIDPSGKVDKRMIAASPSAKDVEMVQKLNSTRPTPVQVSYFLREGGLNAR